MKTNSLGVKTFGFLALVNAALLLVFVAVGTGEAQTRRRARSSGRTVAPRPTPPPATTQPEIISRSDEYLDGNQIVQPDALPAQPVQPEVLTEETAAAAATPTGDLDSRFKRIEDEYSKIKTIQQADDKQKRLLLNLDILTRAETRAENLRRQMFEMIEKESAIRLKLEQIENDSRPEVIERSVAFVGTLRPEELRDLRGKNLASEKRNLENLLTEIQNNKSNLEQNVQKADLLVDKLRNKLEKEIDNAIADEPEN